MTKIEEIKYDKNLEDKDFIPTYRLTEVVDTLNEVISHLNEKENIIIKGETQIEGYEILKIGESKPLSHFFKPESEIIQSYIKEREILLKRLEDCYRLDGIYEEEIKEITKRLQEIDKLILK